MNTPRWTPLALVYLVLAIVGLVGTWTLNILAISSTCSCSPSRWARS